VAFRAAAPSPASERAAPATCANVLNDVQPIETFGSSGDDLAK
jgi:hypothetical protein